MYSKDQEIKFLQQAKFYLELAYENNFAPQENEIDNIVEVINYADWKYYVQDDPVLDDKSYDDLYRLLKLSEQAFPEKIKPESPTQRVAHGLNKDFTSVMHLVPMLSLENSYNAEDLLDWDRKCKELSGEENIAYSVEPKFDGASISLIYEDDKLSRAATRGNGVQGDDITVNAKQIRSIPLKANLSDLGIQQIEIRGEVVMTKERFKQYNDKLLAENLAPLANPRNAASGSLRIKDPREVAKRNLDAFLYHLSFVSTKNNTNVFESHTQALQQLSGLGFKTSSHLLKTCSNIEEVIAYCQEFESKRDDLPYEIDGMVIKVNRLVLQEQIGQTSHHPRWAIAFKFKARQATSKLLSIEYQVGRTGSITPVAKIEPVFVGGVTISSISLFNEEVIREKDLMIGDTILVERAGDVIPYIVKSFPELRQGSEQSIVFPTNCPVCNDALSKPQDEAVWRCTNMDCEAQVLERMIHFASKDAMDIRGLGEANIRRFYELGYLKHLSDIYQLPYEKIEPLDGFGVKSVEKLKEAIEKSKLQPLSRLIFALGIRYVGETTAKTLARSVSDVKELYHKTNEDLIQLEDIGVKVAQSLIDFFSHPKNTDLVEELNRLGLNTVNAEKDLKVTDGGLSGKTFLFTGTLPTLKRSQAEGMAEANGATILSGVSSKLNYLVVGEDAGSKLDKAKKLGSVIILNEAEFLEMLK